MVNIAGDSWARDLDPLKHKLVLYDGRVVPFLTVALTFASRTR